MDPERFAGCISLHGPPLNGYFGIYECMAHAVFVVSRIIGPQGGFFDSNNRQDVLVFEEFCSQISIEDMLNHLGYLPAAPSDPVQ